MVSKRKRQDHTERTRIPRDCDRVISSRFRDPPVHIRLNAVLVRYRDAGGLGDRLIRTAARRSDPIWRRESPAEFRTGPPSGHWQSTPSQYWRAASTPESTATW